MMPVEDWRAYRWRSSLLRPKSLLGKVEGLSSQAHHAGQVALEPHRVPDQLAQLLVHHLFLLQVGLLGACTRFMTWC